MKISYKYSRIVFLLGIFFLFGLVPAFGETTVISWHDPESGTIRQVWFYSERTAKGETVSVTVFHYEKKGWNYGKKKSNSETVYSSIEGQRMVADIKRDLAKNKNNKKYSNKNAEKDNPEKELITIGIANGDHIHVKDKDDPLYKKYAELVKKVEERRTEKE